MAAVNAVSRGGERRCYHCNQPGYLREDCDKLHPEAREYLTQQAARGRGRGRGAGGAEGQGLLPSVQLMCNIWWIVSQVSLQPSYLTSGWLTVVLISTSVSMMSGFHTLTRRTLTSVQPLAAHR